ncbi:MAG: hypothetical protein ACE14S_08100 [Candidatus Bathyarchaeia archaeon]
MSRMPRQEHSYRLLDKAHLQKLKTKAMRSGVWFKALQRIDRALVDLTIRVGTNVRSVTLANSLLTITQKLHELLETRLSRAIKHTGLPTAKTLSAIAKAWGNRTAHAWATDMGFVRYLAIMRLNGHPLMAEHA